MEYRELNGLNKKISKVIYGCCIQEMIEGKNVNSLLDQVYQSGINTFDTAENYGLSEVSLGLWLKNNPNRDNIVVISKGCHPRNNSSRVSVKDLQDDLEQSLTRLAIDKIDIYLLHRDDKDTDVCDMIDILNKYHEMGKIGIFGVSNWTTDRIQEANEYALKHGLIPFSVSSPNYCLCTQVHDPWGGGCISLNGKSNQKERDWYEDNKMPVFAYSGLARGMLSGKVKSFHFLKARKQLDYAALLGYYSVDNLLRLRRAEILSQRKKCTVSEIALAWLFCQKMDVFPIISTHSEKSLLSNIESLHIKLSQEEIKWLNLE